MKKTKKLLALVLALVMAFSLMAVTAAAYGAEEHDHDGACSVETIQPRKPGYYCPKCMGPANCRNTGRTNKEGYDIYKYECPTCGTFDWPE